MDNRQQAQRRVDQIQNFYDELAVLEREQQLLITSEQHQRIHQYHQALLQTLRASFDIDLGQREKQLSWGMKIASFVGALALAASVFFLFYQFWGFLHTPVQVAILAAAPLLTLAMTVVIAARESTGYFAKLCAMVSFACFVLNLVMFGQIFNITPSDKALLAWAAYGVLLAYAFDVRLLLGMGLLAFAGFVAARTATWSGIYWLSMGDRPEHFFLPALFIFTVPLWLKAERFSGFAPIYRVMGCLMLLVSILVLSHWGQASYLSWRNANIEAFYQLLGFVFSAAMIALGIRRGWGDVVNTGNVFFVLFLYTKFFDWWWKSMPKFLFFLVIGLVSILLLFVYRRLRLASQVAAENQPQFTAAAISDGESNRHV